MESISEEIFENEDFGFEIFLKTSNLEDFFKLSTLKTNNVFQEKVM